MAADSPDTKLARTRAFNTKHGQAWSIVEGAGMADGDRPTGALYRTFEDAEAARKQGYEPGELDPQSPDCLHVNVARWDADEECWSYDY